MNIKTDEPSARVSLRIHRYMRECSTEKCIEDIASQTISLRAGEDWKSTVTRMLDKLDASIKQDT